MLLKLTDYVVRMHKLDRNKQMANLLLQHEITDADMQRLPEKMALFHQCTTIIYYKYFRWASDNSLLQDRAIRLPGVNLHTKLNDLLNGRLITKQDF